MKKLVSVLFLLMAFFSIFLLASNIKERIKSHNVVNEIREIKSTTEKIETKKEAKKTTYQFSSYVFKENSQTDLINAIEDYVGWVSIEDTNMDYPIVKAEDNLFYLDHDFYKQENVAGAIFMDRRNLGNAFDQHTLIYGHNLKNGGMFTNLNLYLKEDFYNEHQEITFTDLYGASTYQVISAYYVSADDFELPFEVNETSVEAMISSSLFDSPYTYSVDDRFLTLSTCNYILNNGRMVVHAVKVND